MNNKIKILLVLLVVITLAGCSKSKVISKSTSEETVITNKVENQVLKSSDTIEYKFKTSLYDIDVVAKYGGGYKLKGENLESTYYVVNAYTDEYKVKEYYNSIKEATSNENIIKVDGYEALKMITDIKVMILVKIDEETILYVVGNSDGRCMAEEINNDKDFNDLLKNIKITVKKR